MTVLDVLGNRVSPYDLRGQGETILSMNTNGYLVRTPCLGVQPLSSGGLWSIFVVQSLCLPWRLTTVEELYTYTIAVPAGFYIGKAGNSSWILASSIREGDVVLIEDIYSNEIHTEESALDGLILSIEQEERLVGSYGIKTQEGCYFFGRLLVKDQLV